MRAMILAGGLSTRLYPLTKQVPKPLVPVLGEPNAVHLIRYLAGYGCNEIAINVHYLADAIVERLGDGSELGVHIEYLHEDELLGSAGAVEQMKAFLDGAPFVVVGCDDLTDLPLDQLLDFHKQHAAVATIGLVERAEVDQYGVVVTGDHGRITGFQEKPPKGSERSHLVNTGIYAFTPAIFDWIPHGKFYDFGKNVFPALQQAGAPFYGFDAKQSYWCDIGTIAEYQRATRDALEGRFRMPGTRPSGTDPSARLSPNAVLDGPVWVGANAQIDEGAHIVGPSVISSSVHVGGDAHITESILWEGAQVGRGAQLHRVIAGINYLIEPNARLTNVAVANEEITTR